MSGTAVATASERGALTRNLSGAQKAAIFCMSVGGEAARTVLRGLSPEEVEAISFEVARMETVDPEVAQEVLLEWMDMKRAVASLAGGGEDYARQILEDAFGVQRATHILKRIQSQLTDHANLQQLRKADAQQLTNILRNEHPQVIALILAHLDSVHTANVLKELGAETGKAVVYRMAVMDKVSPEMLQLIERSVGEEIEVNFAQGMSASGGPQAVATVLNLLNPSLEMELLEGLQDADAELCEQVKNLMFVFEDIITLDDRALQRLLREVDLKQLALALKPATHELKERIRSALTTRAAEALQEEVEYLGPQRMRDVEAAQVAIVGKVRMLEEMGEIVINAGAGDDEIIH